MTLSQVFIKTRNNLNCQSFLIKIKCFFLKQNSSLSQIESSEAYIIVFFSLVFEACNQTQEADDMSI